MADHTDRTRAAAELARDVAELLLAGEWEPALVAGRAWFKRWCPRLERDEVETRLVGMGTDLLRLDDLRTRATLAASDYRRLSRDDAVKEFRRLVLARWENEAESYRRRCDRIDSHEPAESKVREFAESIKRRHADLAAA